VGCLKRVDGMCLHISPVGTKDRTLTGISGLEVFQLVAFRLVRLNLSMGRGGFVRNYFVRGLVRLYLELSPLRGISL
jgi:hypothetical protein